MQYESFTPKLRAKMIGDALLEEKPGMDYLVNPNLDEHGFPAHLTGTASGDLYTADPHYPTQLAYLGETNSRGAYLMSYGTFDRSRRHIDTYDNQFKLTRVLSAWQNMAEVPVDQRTWDHEQQTYHSPLAYADEQAIAGVRHDTGDLYAVLLDDNAALHLAEGVSVRGMTDANAFWEPVGRQPAAVVEGGALRPGAGAEFPVSVIAKLDRPEGAAVLAPPPGVELQQDKSTVTLPNRELIDPGFERGGEAWFQSGKRGDLKIVTSPVAEGEKAVRVTGRRQNWHALAQDVTAVLMNTRQGEYRVKARVRSIGEPGEFRVTLQFKERGELQLHQSDPVKAVSHAWVEIQDTFNLNWGDWIDGGRLAVRRIDSLGDYYVDDVELEYLGRH